MFRQYIKFFINGGLLGLVGWGLQIFIYRALPTDIQLAYALASALTYAPLLVINFFIQRRWIFIREGIFFRFILSNLVIMAFVSALAPACKYAIDSCFGEPWGELVGFMLAALISSIPSFLLVRHWVFDNNRPNNQAIH